MRPTGGVYTKRVNQSSVVRTRYKMFGGVIYFVKVFYPGEDIIKIGYTQYPKARLSTIQSHSPYLCALLGALLVPTGVVCKDFEQQVIAHLITALGSGAKMNGEWFNLSEDRVVFYLQQLAKHFFTEIISGQTILERWL